MLTTQEKHKQKTYSIGNILQKAKRIFYQASHYVVNKYKLKILMITIVILLVIYEGVNYFYF
jgi:type III secretory pathway component EscU